MNASRKWLASLSNILTSFFSSLLLLSNTNIDDYADYVMSLNMTEADTEEGIAAFVEKRPPAWDL